MQYAELELGLHWRDIESYALELRFSLTGDMVDITLSRDETKPIQIDNEQLLVHSLDPDAYGRYLSEALFADPLVRKAWDQISSVTLFNQIPLRIRIYVGTSAPNLHGYHWETLVKLDDNTPLFMGELCYFSRYLSSRDWRTVKPRSRTSITAFVAVANPRDLADYQLTPIDVDSELALAREGLAGFPTEVLATAVTHRSVTLNNLIAEMLHGQDILYLVCHGKLISGETWLYLEDEHGNAKPVAANELITRVKELSRRPLLAILVACQSAGSGQSGTDERALAALGPRLAEAGIPAVVAMQGNVTIDFASQFIPIFFRELQQDGQIDRAMALARGTLRAHPDVWKPVLFMRLKSGRIWYSPAFASDQRGDGDDKWPALLTSIRTERCTPIIGPDIVEPLFGSRNDIAWRLARECEYPMDAHDRDGLPQVLQYLVVGQKRWFVFTRLVEQLYQGIRDRYDKIPQHLQHHDLKTLKPGKAVELLDELMVLAWEQRKGRIEADPHQVLAELDCPVYVTTDPSRLLELALEKTGKRPVRRICPWHPAIIRQPRLFEVDYEPDIEQPLVYQLFGSLSYPESLVLTEDDFFDYLIGVTRNSDKISPIVRERLVDSSLLLVGFQAEDWHFRSLFRFLMAQGGAESLAYYSHLAVQIAPEEDRFLDPWRARRYLENYFRHDRTDISIFWGNAEDFAQALQSRYRRELR
ncbi:CHAT domain-containing protein [Candidatus Chloroploca sp. Khr17]|uniref:CHAT domain-containing protein n=1 Tax=Candidatus Chloroploca sp. Khr17 TaxID=2496869 RepID=UPI00101BAC4F|nr:CHAT domain-containing protein [Candidatus Chloroploca sp. Khr17]